MRRALVLTHEAARHPFRANLPRHIFTAEPAQPRRPDWLLSAADMRGVANTYFATLVATLAFIA